MRAVTASSPGAPDGTAPAVPSTPSVDAAAVVWIESERLRSEVGPGTEVEVRLANGLPPVTVGHPDLAPLIRDLLLDALATTTDDGLVLVEVDLRTAPPWWPNVPSGPLVVVGITDTGTGSGPRRRLLSVASRARRLGVRLRMRNVPGIGTTVDVLLKPLETITESREPDQSPKTGGVRAGQQVDGQGREPFAALPTCQLPSKPGADTSRRKAADTSTASPPTSTLRVTAELPPASRSSRPAAPPARR